jgi:hypothetical protein
MLKSGLFLAAVLLSGLFTGSSRCFAVERAIYASDEASGLDVPDEFKLKYQVPEKWLLDEEQTDLLGARSSWRGFMGVNYRYFFSDGLFPSQTRDDISLIAEPEYSLTWPSGNFFVFTPYLQYDNTDDERSHVDIRELFFSVVGGAYELRVGIEKIFWGVTESQNLVDVINQSDLVAHGKRSDKLGQPMVNLSMIQDWGTVDFFVMPYFRERTYPGKDGRLRAYVPIDTDLVQYESASEEHHVDFAVRYSHYLGELEFGLSYFKGTSRDPDIRGANFILTDSSTTPIPTVLYPYYYQMDQVGLDVQYILGGWLLKGEIINRQSDVADYTAWTTGFEYTFTGVFGSESDVSLLSEWLHDDRRVLVTFPFEDDIMVGTRIAFNDINSSEITVSVIRDIDEDPTLLSIEASRRLTDHWKINLDAYWWWEEQRYDAFYDLRDDDFVSLTLAYYF